MPRKARTLALRRREPGPWWPWLALAAATLACCSAYAQTTPETPSAAPPTTTAPSTARPLPQTTDRAGVLRPPAEIDPKMKVAPPPATSPMPVIHPEITPHDGTIVIPK